VGACRQGIQTCTNGSFETACVGEVKPTAETCNAIDDDCNGQVDDGVLQTFYVDRDGDGFGSSAAGAQTQQACTRPTGFSATNTDCNDTPGAGSTINPSATEVCDSANVDEDCNGMSNENCACQNVGMSQTCCAGRGMQTCEARPGGASLSACTVVAAIELCNGIDDDCDGQTDEQFSLKGPDGGLVGLADAGVLQLDGGCAVGIGACARTGAAVCTSGSLLCNVTAGTPSAEICNNLDDDCNGQTDEASPTLCAVTGQACTNGTCACPSGQSVCGTSCQAVGGSCSVGTGACTRQGSIACTNGTATCDAVAGTPTTETCNNIDDNCDGQVDEVSATLCAVTGQSCNVGTCSCPANQSVCGTSCQSLGGSCSAGLGACLRTGVIACTNGGASCNATAGSPVAETCDGVDNDCDGTIDNGVTITCYPDGDNDLFATSNTPSQQCPVATRSAAGFCPSGFVAPAASPGVDCAPADPSLYRVNSTRADADNDTYCFGAVTTACMGAPAQGRRFLSGCALTDDCNDANSAVYQNLSVRTDLDGDGYCVGGTATQCAGSSPAVGTRVSTICRATDDCNDNSASLFLNYSVRTDGDNDGYCVGSTVTQCAGNAPLAGTRVATSCQGEDCKDNNAAATSTCTFVSRYWTGSVVKNCGIGYPATSTYTFPASNQCPIGFSVANLWGFIPQGDPGGTCTPTSATSVTMTCGSLVLGYFTCGVQGDCVAN
jgi:hypothetical protein